MTLPTDSTAPAAPPQAARQFDFWLGDWDVSWGDQRATNSVTAILGGAVIQEQFDGRPSADWQGMSVSVYDPRRAEWRQTWVDSQGNYWAFTGGFADGRMTLSTDDVRDNRPVKLRMTFYNLAADSLDWSWERSDNGGESWTVLWQLHYERRAS
jgi:hypothetical protein